MSIKDILLFRWLVNLFRSDRWELIKKLTPLARPYVDRVRAIDWDHDGTVESIRAELAGLLEKMPEKVVKTIFKDYFTREGELVAGTVLFAALPSLKKLYAIALFVKGWLSSRAEPLPTDLSVIDSAVQLGYEDAQKTAKPALRVRRLAS